MRVVQQIKTRKKLVQDLLRGSKTVGSAGVQKSLRSDAERSGATI